jgi:hypothetical protein
MPYKIEAVKCISCQKLVPADGPYILFTGSLSEQNEVKRATGRTETLTFSEAVFCCNGCMFSHLRMPNFPPTKAAPR